MRIVPQSVLIDGPVGPIETIVEAPAAPRGIALVGHPHPLFGGTNTNKVAQTLAKTMTQLGYVALRPSFRGVGQSAGTHDEGRGETDDQLAVLDWAKATYGDLPIILCGFSFGGICLSFSRGNNRRFITVLLSAFEAITTTPFLPPLSMKSNLSIRKPPFCFVSP